MGGFFFYLRNETAHVRKRFKIACVVSMNSAFISNSSEIYVLVHAWQSGKAKQQIVKMSKILLIAKKIKHMKIS